MATATRQLARTRRHIRVRKRLEGTSERPRLAVYRSLQHTYAQLIDDRSHVTLAAASSQDKELREKLKSGANKTAAEAVGDLIAKRAAKKGIKVVVFDRGGFRYQGRVALLAEAARKAGLEF